jgi:hypothetical protein
MVAGCLAMGFLIVFLDSGVSSLRMVVLAGVAERVAARVGRRLAEVALAVCGVLMAEAVVMIDARRALRVADGLRGGSVGGVIAGC